MEKPISAPSKTSFAPELSTRAVMPESVSGAVSVMVMPSGAEYAQRIENRAAVSP